MVGGMQIRQNRKEDAVCAWPLEETEYPMDCPTTSSRSLAGHLGARSVLEFTP